MVRRRPHRPGREHAWVLAAAVTAIALVFGWWIVPAILAGSFLAAALVPVLQMAGSLLGAFAGIVALKLYLEREPKGNDTLRSTNYSGNHPNRAAAPPTRFPEPNRLVPQKPEMHPSDPVQRDWTLELLRSLEWKRFEDLCNAYSQIRGLRTETTNLGADGGVDIRIHHRKSGALMGVVQCKAYGSDIGVRFIRELAGVMASEKVAHGVFITTSGFTKDAVEFAEKNGIILLDGPGFLRELRSLSDNDQKRLLDLATSGDYTTPTCPRCGIKMVRRHGKNGYGDFWGCQNFPRCRQTLKIRKPRPAGSPTNPPTLPFSR